MEAMGTKNLERRPLASIVSSWSLHILKHYTSLMQNSLAKPFFFFCFLLQLQMLAALKNSPDSMNMSSLKEFVDPNMMDLYPHDCLFKVN